jgi:hypothetical protein
MLAQGQTLAAITFSSTSATPAHEDPTMRFFMSLWVNLPWLSESMPFGEAENGLAKMQ